MATVDRYAIQIDTTQATRALNEVRLAVAGLLGGLSVVTLVSFADSITNLKNRLLQLTPSMEAANAQFKAIAAIAIAARSDLEATGDLYFRIARSADQLGISQREAAEITTSLAKALTASGQSGKESAGPLLQLGQALQSGVVQGDELRSILEGLQPVSKALADYLKVPVGQLKTLGAEGKITATDLVNALKAAGPEIEAAFNKTIPSISQAFNTLKTTFALAFNEFESGTQTGQKTAGAIELLAFYVYKLAKSMDEIAPKIIFFGKVIATLLAVTLVGKAFGAVSLLFRTFASGLTIVTGSAKKVIDVFGALRGGAVGFGGALLRLIPGVSSVIAGLTVLGGVLTSVYAGFKTWLGLGEVGNYLDGVGKSGSDAQKDLEAFRKEIAKLNEGFSDTKTEGTANQVAMAKIAKEVRNVTLEYQQLIAANQRRYTQQTALINLSDQERTRIEALQEAENNYLTSIEPLLKRYRELQQTGKKEDAAASTVLSKKIKELSDAYAASLPSLKEDVYQRILANRELRIQSVEYNNLINSLSKVRAIREEISSLGLAEAERATRTAEAQNRAAEEEAIRQENIARLGQENYLKGMRLPESDPGIVRIRQSFAQALREEKAALDDLYPAKLKDQQLNYTISQNIRARQEQAQRNLELEKLGLSDIEKKYKDIDFAAEERANNEIDRLDKILLSTQELAQGISIRNLPQYADLVKEIRDNASQGIEAQKQAARTLEDTTRSFSFGWTQAMKDYIYNATNAAQQVQNIFRDSTKAMENSIVQFARKGKFEWKSMIADMLEALLRSQIQQNLAKIFIGAQNANSAFQGGGRAGGGGFLDAIGAGISKLFGGFFADGGRLPAGQFGIVGERGPELISGPANITPMTGMGGVTNVTYNISAVDAMSFKALVASDPQFIHAVAAQGGRSLPGRR
jgi:tape measure domain-containing protein